MQYRRKKKMYEEHSVKSKHSRSRMYLYSTTCTLQKQRIYFAVQNWMLSRIICLQQYDWRYNIHVCHTAMRISLRDTQHSHSEQTHNIAFEMCLQYAKLLVLFECSGLINKYVYSAAVSTFALCISNNRFSWHAIALAMAHQNQNFLLIIMCVLQASESTNYCGLVGLLNVRRIHWILALYERQAMDRRQ